MIETTIIIPFYYKFDLFKLVFENNEKYFNSTHEIIITVDEPDSGVLLKEFFKDKQLAYSLKILENKNKHEYRTPAKAINVGIRQASGKFIIITYPNSLFLTNIPELLVNECKFSFELNKVYCTTYGRCIFTNKEDFLKTDFDSQKYFWYGSLCSTKDALIKIQGIDENTTYWGSDDIDTITRLAIAGYSNGIAIEEAKIIQVETTRKERIKNPRYTYLSTYKGNTDDWGKDF
ncbi:MAG: glycosyltransferase family A protein [Candidatus Paceibacterota bacterium]|jgi:hypothetical protein